jgi:hypothetical protein
MNSRWLYKQATAIQPENCYLIARSLGRGKLDDLPRFHRANPRGSVRNVHSQIEQGCIIAHLRGSSKLDHFGAAGSVCFWMPDCIHDRRG